MILRMQKGLVICAREWKGELISVGTLPATTPGGAMAHLNNWVRETDPFQAKMVSAHSTALGRKIQEPSVPLPLEPLWVAP